MKQYSEYPNNVKAAIDKAGGLEEYRLQMKERRGRVKNPGRNGYFSILKKEGRIDELRALQANRKKEV